MAEAGRGTPDLMPLAALPMFEWPGLARRWLEDGYRSQALIDFATLSPAEAHVLADLMFEVLTSLGVHVGAGTDIGAWLFTISGFQERCRRAIEPVAADLAKTWKAMSLHARVVVDEPPLGAQVIIGRDLSSSSNQMTADMDDDELAATAATQVSEAFLEVAGYLWPFCISHSRRMVVRLSGPGEGAVWRCDGPAGHPAVEIGKLNTNQARSDEMWWAADRRFDLDSSI